MELHKLTHWEPEPARVYYLKGSSDGIRLEVGDRAVRLIKGGLCATFGADEGWELGHLLQYRCERLGAAEVASESEDEPKLTQRPF